VLRHLDGAPVVPLRRDDHWGGDSWVLDATRRDVREHLAAVAHGHAAMGWRILKLDFLYSTGSIGDVTAERAAAGLPPTGERLSTAEVTRAVYEALRAGAGEDVLLQACGAPLWPAVGLVDIMRVGPDARRHWGPHPLPGIEDAMMRCLGNCWRAARLRADFHDRLWANDPDLVMLRPGRCELTAEQRIGWADWVAASGQALTLSDSFADLGPPERFIWERTVTTWRLTRAGRPRGPRGAAQGVATSTSKAEAMTR
jgi:alpha-galactosidase